MRSFINQIFKVKHIGTVIFLNKASITFCLVKHLLPISHHQSNLKFNKIIYKIKWCLINQVFKRESKFYIKIKIKNS